MPTLVSPPRHFPWIKIAIFAFVLLIVIPGLIIIGLTGFRLASSQTSSGVAGSRVANGITTVSAPMMATDSYGGSTVTSEKATYAPGAPMPIAPPIDQTGGYTAAEVDQKIIKNASLQLVVDHAADSADRISALATARGGFTQNSSISENEDGTKFGQVTVRVPTSKFDDLLAAIRSLAVVVSYESVSGQDVTEQYTDLEARLTNAQAQEKTYLAVLDRAKTVEDILKVQTQLGMIRETIERYQGQLKYLENMTSYSTVNVTLSEEAIVKIGGNEFRPGTAVKEALQALVKVAQQAVIAVIWLVILWGGALIPLALLVWLIVWAIRKRKAKRQ